MCIMNGNPRTKNLIMKRRKIETNLIETKSSYGRLINVVQNIEEDKREFN